MSAPFAIAGVVPRDVVTPHGVEELARTVRELYENGKAFAFLGGGTHRALGNAPRALHTVVRTVALDRVLEYAAEDQTITVEAGMTLAELDRVLAEHRQMLPLDVADREHATVGGVVATNVFGRRRQRYGTVKDHIVGVTIVRPDGTPARGGGRVVKNVAGFDLPKLMTGSLGTLGAIVSATFRVHPIADARASAVLAFDDANGAARAAQALVDARLDPESVAVYNGNALAVSFAGTAGGVAAQLRTLVEQVASRSGAADVRELVDDEPESYDQRERAVRRDGDWRFRIDAPPASRGWAIRPDVPSPPLAVPVAYPLLGVAFHAHAAAGMTSTADPWNALRERVSRETGANGRVVIEAMPDEARATTDAWGPPPSSLRLMRALKEAFDPRGLCNAGRFVGGL